tara:strand:+ start:99 stop:404 length:306 start_codon:yes stop_codon:yes gene_type:complete
MATRSSPSQASSNEAQKTPTRSPGMIQKVLPSTAVPRTQPFRKLFGPLGSTPTISEVEEHDMEMDQTACTKEKADFIARQSALEETEWSEFCADLEYGDFC